MTDGVALQVLAESEDFVVVSKPIGVSTEPDRRSQPSLRDEVARWLSQRGRGTSPHALSRLDVTVSGAVTFSISERGHALAPKLKESGRLRRTYGALVTDLALDEGRWNAPIDGRHAESRFETLARSPLGVRSAALALLRPITGRTHQLRIHCSSHGAPILGDRRYGGAGSLATTSGRVVRIERTMLHATRVTLTLGDGELIAVDPLPRAFGDLWRDLGGGSAEFDAASKRLTHGP